MTKKGFMDCPDCRVWGDIPKDFKETLHFGKCPNCGKAMFLVRGIDPIKELGFSESKKVVCGLMLHGEKL